MAVNVGKPLAYLIGFFVVAFLILSFANPTFLQDFMDWTIKILGIITAGVVVYIIFKITIKKK